MDLASEEAYQSIIPMEQRGLREGGDVSVPSEEGVLPAQWSLREQVDLELVVAVVVCAASIGVEFSPHERPIPSQQLGGEDGPYYVRNLMYNDDFHGNTVPNLMLIILSYIVPLALQLAFSVYQRDHHRHDVHSTLCVYFLTFGLNRMATNFVKDYVGYLRPIFYYVCQPDESYSECTQESNEARRSFPSGHASTAFSGLLLLSLFFHTRWGIRRFRLQEARSSQSHPHFTPKAGRHRLISILSLAPTALALFIAASRVRDNKHFPADVTAGAVLGGSLAMFCHGLYFDD